MKQIARTSPTDLPLNKIKEDLIFGRNNAGEITQVECKLNHIFKEM